MSIYFNPDNNLCGDMTDCLYSDSSGTRHPISSIWGTKNSNVVKLWEKKTNDPYAVGSYNDLTCWYYKLDEANNTVTLTKFNSGTANVVAYSSYELNGKVYRTKIGNSGENYSNGLFNNANGKYIKSIVFGNNIDFSNTTNMGAMFFNCNALESVDFGSNFNTSNVTNMAQMFYRCKALESVDLSNFNTSNVTNMTGMFEGCEILKNLDLIGFNTDNVSSMEKMFYQCKMLKTLNLNSFNTSNVTSMNSMFRDCNTLENVYISNFDTCNVTDMSYMFCSCNLLTDINKYMEIFNTNNVKFITSMFAGTNIQNADMSNWNIKNVINMDGLFSGSINLKYANMENLELTNACNLSYMFLGCTSLKDVNLKNIKFKTIFNKGDPTFKMTRMFENCTSLESVDLTTWALHESANLDYMFSGCSNLKAVYIDRNIWKYYSAINIFLNTDVSSFTYI